MMTSMHVYIYILIVFMTCWSLIHIGMSNPMLLKIKNWILTKMNVCYNEILLFHLSCIIILGLIQY